jgi:hypothetical protein
LHWPTCMGFPTCMCRPSPVKKLRTRASCIWTIARSSTSARSTSPAPDPLISVLPVVQRKGIPESSKFHFQRPAVSIPLGLPKVNLDRHHPLKAAHIAVCVATTEARSQNVLKLEARFCGPGKSFQTEVPPQTAKVLHIGAGSFGSGLRGDLAASEIGRLGWRPLIRNDPETGLQLQPSHVDRLTSASKGVD